MASVIRILAICILLPMVAGMPINLVQAARPIGTIMVSYGGPYILKLSIGFGQFSPTQPTQLVPNLKVIWYLWNGSDLILVTHQGNYSIVAFGQKIVLLDVFSLDERTNSTGWATLTYTTQGCFLEWVFGGDVYNRINHLPGPVLTC